MSKCNDCKYNSGLCKICIKDKLFYAGMNNNVDKDEIEYKGDKGDKDRRVYNGDKDRRGNK